MMTNIPPPVSLPDFVTSSNQAIGTNPSMSNSQFNYKPQNQSSMTNQPGQMSGNFPISLTNTPCPQPQNMFVPVSSQSTENLSMPGLPGSQASQNLSPSTATHSKIGPPPSVTSQPESQTNSFPKGHYRHHSFPVYPSNIIQPPCNANNMNRPYLNTVASGSSACNLDYSQMYMPINSNPAPNVGNSATFDMGTGGPLSPSTDQTGWFGWIRDSVSSVGTKVAEKAKTSMDTVITTLDPQMKELINSGGEVDVFVASVQEVKVGPIREAFQYVFGKATVNGLEAQPSEMAAQPVGMESAMASAEQRINFLRSSGKVHPQQPIIAVESFVLELTKDSWYELSLLLMDDPWHDVLLHTCTQMTPVPLDYIKFAKQGTPPDYPYISCGFSNTIGKIAGQALQVHHQMWQEALCGVPRREMILLAARTLAGLYKSRLPHAPYQAAVITPN